MKKTFQFQRPKHEPPRVLAAIKNDLRKYLKRERKKKLPDDVDFWDFDCRTGKDEESAEIAHVAELIAAIDKASQAEWPSIYIEILAKSGYRKPKGKIQDPEK